MCSLGPKGVAFGASAHRHRQRGCIIDEEQDLSVPKDLLATRPHYRHKSEKLKSVDVLLLLVGITQIVVEEPWSSIYPIPDNQQPWWANRRTHEPFVGLLIDDHESKSTPHHHESKSTPHHAEASVRVYYHLDSRKRLSCVTSPLSKAGLF